MNLRRLVVMGPLALAAPAWAQSGGGLDLTWNSYDCGGGISTGGGIELLGTIGQADAGRAAGWTIECLGGFLGAAGGALCYPNCDASTVQPVLNVNDFVCFLNRFAAADPYANCDQSTQPPTLNVNDFICFLNRFAAGCG